MNSRGRKIYSLLALALAGCYVRAERNTTYVNKTWPSAQIKRIEVREVDGTINIHGAATDQVNLNARVRTYGKPKEDAFQASVEGDTLVIGRRQHHFRFFSWNEPRIDYDVTVPPTVELKLTTVNGQITTRGVAGECAATTVNGSLDLETDGTKEVTGKSVNGRIVCTFKKDFQGATFKTVNGRVVAALPPNASFYGDFTQVNGDFEAAFPLDIHSHPGSRRVSGEVNGGKYELRIKTVNGDIKIENLGGASIPKPPAPSAPPSAPSPSAIPAPPPPPAPST
ncbi:MAG TPA: DUF4097 family beta strand repeat-containing protein [Thermoanaerobaculia bacterium]|nr:DUF4097 family beta strand repeat-containing protein [Thermoanaerobaculia bacterium]